MNKPVILSEHAYAVAEQQARENGCDTVEEYLNTLFGQEDAMPDWIREKLEEGLASPSEPITEEEIRELVAEGIALAQRNK
jgi:hypothetical protein